MEDKKSQEVDMIDIMAKIKKYAAYWFEKFTDFLTYVLRLTYTYKYAFCLLALVAVGLTVYLNTGNRKIYRGDTTLKINAGTAYNITDLMNELNSFVKRDDSYGLAEALNISEKEAASICFIKCYPFVAINKDSTRAVIDYNDNYKINDTTNVRVKDRLVVSVGLHNRNLFPKMQTTLLNYLNNNDYLKELYDLRIGNLLQREEIINQDIAKLDSLQNKQFFQCPKNEVYLTNITELRTGKQDLFYKDKQTLLDKKTELEADLAGSDGIVNIFSPFHPTSKAYQSPIRQFVCVFSLLYLLFVLGASAMKYRKEIKAFLKG